MMISIQNTWTTRTISHKDVATAAKDAQQQVLQEIEEQPSMGICDKIVDTLFHAKLKQTALNLIQDMSRSTAEMESELGKSLSDRNQKTIKKHLDAIKENQQKLNKLMGDKSLEFGREDTRSVVGTAGYLILRTESDLNPIGIPMQGSVDEEMRSQKLPNFRAASNIGVDDIQRIRRAEKLICAGKIYTIKFNRRNCPEVLVFFIDNAWSQLQIKLLTLFNKHPKDFELIPSGSEKSPAFNSSPAISESEKIQTTTSIQILAPSESMEDGARKLVAPVISMSIPTFETAENIGPKHIKQIRHSSQIICWGKTYQLEFNSRNVPEIIGDNQDKLSNILLHKLFNLWQYSQEQFVPDLPDIPRQSIAGFSSSLSTSEIVQTEISDTTVSASSSVESESRVLPEASLSPQAIPTFETDDSIGFRQIRQIRICGQMRYNGKVYRLEFDNHNKPKVLCDGRNRDSIMLEDRLFRLWSAFPDYFVLDQLEQAEQLKVISSHKLPMAEVDHQKSEPPSRRVDSAENGISDQEIPAVDIATSDTEGFSFVRHFHLIQRSRKIKYNGKMYRVEIHERNEPIVLTDSTEPNAKSAQAILTIAWFKFQANLALDQLRNMRAVSAALSLPPMFPEFESERFRLRVDMGLEKEWLTAARAATKSFKSVLRQFQRDVSIGQIPLIAIFEKFSREAITSSAQKKILFEAQTKLTALSVKQDNLNANIERFKEIHLKLFQMARTCTSSEMQQIYLNRVRIFNMRLDSISKIDLSADSLNDLDSLLRNHSIFFKNFDDSQFLLCSALLVDPSEVILQDRTRAAVPKKIALAPLRKILTDRLSDPALSWEEIQDAQDKLQRAQDKLIKAFVIKLNAGIDIDNAFLAFMGRHGEGLDPESGKSLYTPETYSRIVSLKETRDELNNRYGHLSERVVLGKMNESREHISHIERETRALQIFERSPGFTGHITYIPSKNSDRSDKNFSEWCRESKKNIENLD